MIRCGRPIQQITERSLARMATWKATLLVPLGADPVRMLSSIIDIIHHIGRIECTLHTYTHRGCPSVLVLQTHCQDVP